MTHCAHDHPTPPCVSGRYQRLNISCSAGGNDSFQRRHLENAGDSTIRTLYTFLCALLMTGCALPPMPERSESHALEPEQAAQTSLDRAIAPQLLNHPGQSGFHALQDPIEAFAARILLARTAERNLDVQYYIWRGDQTGTLLLQELVAAADRGVHVRLLLDDAGTAGLDGMLAALAMHQRIEVRLFNPFVVRKPKFLGYLTDFGRANRRMHNKSFTADNQASIVGGRNVGDEYFGATDGVLFSDLDLLVVGAVVPEVAQNFDHYWTSQSAYPAQTIVPAVGTTELQALEAEATRIAQSDTAQDYVEAVRQTPFIQQLLQQQLSMEWASTTLVSDDPKKGLGHAKRTGLLVSQVQDVIGTPQRSVVLVSPYFVPTATGVQALADLRQRGIRVRVMTNAYESTDVPLVHAGYAKYRKALLKHGVELYEMQRMAPASTHARLNPLGSSGSSLHAKTFAVDSARAFVGSFNFDPRSALLNTELGVIIDSPLLARKIEQAFDTQIPGKSYRVQLSDSGKLQWHSLHKGSNAQPTIYSVEPGSSWLSRWSLWMLALLPFEWML
ncbi:MAG: phospholipase D family protein [Desulfuromonadaceae bacterium]|nr:phospholipase D family protein [Desulfuromonadaceae bacterium]